MINRSSTKNNQWLQRFSPISIGIILVLVISAAIRLIWLMTPVVRDEGAVGYVAMVWATKGILPYQAPMAAVNPPFAYILYLIPSAIFGNNIIPVRIMNDVLFLLSIISLFLIAKNWFGQRVGFFSAAFYGVFLSAPIFEANLAIPSSLALPFSVFSIYFLTFWQKNRKKLPLFISGFFMCLATLILQYYVLGIALIFAIIIYTIYVDLKVNKQSLRKLQKTSLPEILVALIGFFLLIAGISAYFYSQGIFRTFLDATVTRFIGSTSYISQGEVNFSMLFLTVTEASPLWLFSIIGIALCLRKRHKSELLLVLWFFLMLLIAIPPPHFGRHFAQLVPVLAILSGLAVVTLMGLINFKPLQQLNNNRIGSKRAISIFLITAITLTMIPAIFQSYQYPNTNYPNPGSSLFGESWSYTFSNNWTEQQELVNFVKLNAGDQPVFIHGWEAELYWLTSHLAPNIRWASSYNFTMPAMPDIASKDYRGILDQVNNGSFRYIILMKAFENDTIMNAVYEKYYYLQEIGNYKIFDKYPTQWYSQSYGFVANLSKSYQECWLFNGTKVNMLTLNDPTFNATSTYITLQNVTKPAILQVPTAFVNGQHANSTLIFNDVFVPENSRLNLGVTIPDALVNPTDGVVFEILVSANNSMPQIPIYSWSIDKKNVQAQHFGEDTIVLSQFYGQNVTFYFITNAGVDGDIYYDWACWLNPQILQRGTS